MLPSRSDICSCFLCLTHEPFEKISLADYEKYYPLLLTFLNTLLPGPDLRVRTKGLEIEAS